MSPVNHPTVHADGHFQNWSGRITAHPRALEQPDTREAIQDVVRKHAGTIRVVGTGHSCTALCATDGLLLNLDRHCGVVRIDSSTRRATLRAGSKLHDLGPPLHEAGLAFHNLGDVDVQALAGALSTGTHGTGPTLGNLATAVRRMELVLASGETLVCSEDEEAEVFRLGRVSLGALGVLSEIDVELLPAYNLHEKEWKAEIAEAGGFLERAQQTRHLEFFWSPPRDVLYMKSLDPTEAPADPLPESPRERIGPSHEILPSVREERFNEMEFSVPAERGIECFREIRERMRSHHPDVMWPVEVRTVAADDIPLSPASRRATVTISVHQAAELPCDALFADCQAIFANYAGRPHWGKAHSLEAHELAPLYPEWDAFARLRERLDPAGRFASDYMRALLGI